MIEQEKAISDFIDTLLSIDRIKASEIAIQIHTENLYVSLRET